MKATVRRRPVQPGNPAWFATVERPGAHVVSAYPTQAEAAAALPGLAVMLDAPVRAVVVEAKGWGL